jgi:hypothetical protein
MKKTKQNDKGKVSKIKSDPIAYDTEYFDFATIDDYKSDSDISELESEISEKNEDDIFNVKDVEELNNKYSFIKQKTQLTRKVNVDTNELKKEEYLEDEEEVITDNVCNQLLHSNVAS